MSKMKDQEIGKVMLLGDLQNRRKRECDSITALMMIMINCKDKRLIMNVCENFCGMPFNFAKIY